MSEENNNEENNDIDLDALENSIQESFDDERDDQSNDDENDDAGEDDKFDLDAALESDVVELNLGGKITEDQAVEKAKERGWREDGEDKFGHKISAIEFLERTPLFHKMSLMKGDIEEQSRQIKALTENSIKIAQKAVEDKKSLNAELKEAKDKLLSNDVLDADDIKELKDIDKQIEETSVTEEDNLSEKENEIVEEYKTAKAQFDKDNPWYNNNRAMTLVADKVGVEFAEEYHKQHGVMPEPDVTFKHVLDEVKKDFPDMGKPKRGNRVASRGNRTIINKSSSKKSISDLPEDQQAVAKEVMEAAGISEADYLKTYKF